MLQEFIGFVLGICPNTTVHATDSIITFRIDGRVLMIWIRDGIPTCDPDKHSLLGQYGIVVAIRRFGLFIADESYENVFCIQARDGILFATADEPAS